MAWRSPAPSRSCRTAGRGCGRSSLYGTLEDARGTGLIEELDDPRHRPADESEKKRFYRLTRAGHRALAPKPIAWRRS